MLRKTSSTTDLWRPSNTDHRDAPGKPGTPFVLDTFEEQLAKSLEAFDVACSAVLNQLAEDLTPPAHGEPPASLQGLTASDLRIAAQQSLEDAQSSSDQARIEHLAQHAFRIAQLAEKMDRDEEDKSA